MELLGATASSSTAGAGMQGGSVQEVVLTPVGDTFPKQVRVDESDTLCIGSTAESNGRSATPNSRNTEPTCTTTRRTRVLSLHGERYE